ncbi:hypothetical protein [Agromyces badenianii]|uniref:hypothetical protein n=1 Tax=Agromyces badenianii TaxID=2080742 RepID=UPI0014050B93|nr:hypothetical protein [Agromyces badenianii]
MNVVAFFISMGLFVFGMWLMGTAPEAAAFQAPLFFGGIVSVAVSLAIPFHLLGRSDGV